MQVQIEEYRYHLGVLEQVITEIEDRSYSISGMSLEKEKDYSFKRLRNSQFLYRFYNSGKNLVQKILDTKEIPKEDLKKFESVATLLVGFKRAPNNIRSWWFKNVSLFKWLVDSKNWPSKEGKKDLKYKVGPFTIHNTLGLSDKALLDTNAAIEAAVKYLKNSTIPKMSETLYGEVFIVGSLKQKRTLAWYSIKKDTIFLRPFDDFGSEVILNLLHEIGHRYWRKVLSPNSKKDWKSFYLSLKSGDDSGELNSEQKQFLENLKQIKPGEEFPLKIQGMIRGPKPKVQRAGGSPLVFVITNGSKMVTISYRDVLKSFHSNNKKRSKATKFPTLYSQKDEEEFFCEAFSLFAMNRLGKEWSPMLEKVLG